MSLKQRQWRRLKPAPPDLSSISLSFNCKCSRYTYSQKAVVNCQNWSPTILILIWLHIQHLSRRYHLEFLRTVIGRPSEFVCDDCIFAFEMEHLSEDKYFLANKTFWKMAWPGQRQKRWCHRNYLSRFRRKTSARSACFTCWRISRWKRCCF